MARISIVYSTVDGHTRKICERLGAVLERHAHQVRLLAVQDAAGAALEDCDRIVVGACIRYGRHRADLVRFIERNAQALNRKAGAFFSVSVVARKPGRDQPHNNPYVRRLLGRSAWRPRAVAVFAGKIDYPRYRSLDRWVIRAIMWLTGGPTDPAAVVEFTDWRKVEAFGELIAAL